MGTKVAIVTGGGRGIGKGIVLSLAQADFDVVVNFASGQTTALETVSAARSFGVRAEAIQADISNREDRVRLISDVERMFGRLDLLVNNAGVAPKQRVDLLDATEESFDHVIGVNLKGPYFLSQLAARLMIQQIGADPGIRPKIINISSISSYTSSTSRGDYCISKAGIAMMTQLYADRLAPYGIGVFEIRPGIISTDMTAQVRERYDQFIDQNGLPITRWGKPEDVGKAVLAIALDLLPYSTGEILNVDGGFHLRRL